MLKSRSKQDQTAGSRRRVESAKVEAVSRPNSTPQNGASRGLPQRPPLGVAPTFPSWRRSWEGRPMAAALPFAGTSSIRLPPPAGCPPCFAKFIRPGIVEPREDVR
ncbi:hypothetical protein GGTG_08868 [Gaeumannomyces tritici R3-111a-1]|uniref:Uncharacterized protein n=1 Tax=Gaeumannomyces tritici (strain R3-111a-1) TaxID=644352 RepID=J3P5S8_GAET3|nr:hypothetical protein GGTG_08868 [Gaeumannomyces tritici R3-111a-1]EJT75030.1 hypothetical protein GGTG_08868 [Gaeumannomyces tritici R3-111a-1]